MICFTLLNPPFWSALLNFWLVISFFIALYNSVGLSLFKTMQWSVVSGKPPLLEIIVAQALEEASNAVRPKGSSHLDGITAISDF